MIMRSSAEFDSDRKFRYALYRVWDDRKPNIGFLLCNPSTADENVLDPTLTRCLNYAQRFGGGGMAIANLFGLRSTDPKKLATKYEEGKEIVGDANDSVIQRISDESSLLIVGWGEYTGKVGRLVHHRAQEVLRMLKGRTIYALATCKDGCPRHPLYLPADLEPNFYNSDILLERKFKPI